MDDFGTGYSSLSYLRSFPFDKIKIDRSFISGLPDDSEVRRDRARGRGARRDLNMTTTAEGVETHEQLAGGARARLRRNAGLSVQPAAAAGHARPALAVAAPSRSRAHGVRADLLGRFVRGLALVAGRLDGRRDVADPAALLLREGRSRVGRHFGR